MTNKRFKCPGTIAATLVAIVLATWGIWAGISHAAPRALAPVSVVMIEQYEGMAAAYCARHGGEACEAAYEAAYEAVPPMERTSQQVSESWPSADRATIAAAALLGTMEKASRDTWQPGYEEYLRGLQFTMEEIRAAVFFQYGRQVALITDAVLLALGKPLP